jgi:hypothetical protein
VPSLVLCASVLLPMSLASVLSSMSLASLFRLMSPSSALASEGGGILGSDTDASDAEVGMEGVGGGALRRGGCRCGMRRHL